MERKIYPLDFPPRLAKDLGVDPSYISRIKHGRGHPPSPKMALAIYRKLNGNIKLHHILRPSLEFLEVCQILCAEDNAKNGQICQL